MGFWKKLFGLEGKKNAKFDITAKDGDGDGMVQDGTIWERPAELAVDLDATLAKAEKLLKEVAPEKKTKKSSTTKKAPAKKPVKKTTTSTKKTTKKADPKKAKPKATKKK